jgi:hypothetical protein
MNNIVQASVPPISSGEPFYTSDISVASYTRSGDDSSSSSGRTSQTRINRASQSNTQNRFSSIRMGMMPYEYASD